MTQPVLHTPRLLLRPFTLTDAAAVQLLAGDSAVADTTLTIPHPYEDGMAEAWIATHAAACAARTNVVLAITEPVAGVVGAIGLRLEQDHRHAEASYWIGVPYWGRGYATEALVAMIQYGFAGLGLDRIVAHHLTRNPASGRVMLKAGMRHEGIRRQQAFKAGALEDLECYGILRDDPVPPPPPRPKQA